MTTSNHYTFGDGAEAARRLEMLARAYEEPSRRLLERFRPLALEVALDLGSGPGHTTRLLHDVSGARRTVGLEASQRYVDQARVAAKKGVEFMREDVTAPSDAVPLAGLVFSRFLLTHVSDPSAVLRAFRRIIEPGGLLVLQETARMESSHPALARYYELVGQLQAHYGQSLYIGRDLSRYAVGAPYRVVHSTVQYFEQPAPTMAKIHLQNLRTWRTDPFAEHSFDRSELDGLEQGLDAIAEGASVAQAVAIGLGELVLE
jgi:trans-aconitate methyltransferase